MAAALTMVLPLAEKAELSWFFGGMSLGGNKSEFLRIVSMVLYEFWSGLPRLVLCHKLFRYRLLSWHHHPREKLSRSSLHLDGREWIKERIKAWWRNTSWFSIVPGRQWIIDFSPVYYHIGIQYNLSLIHCLPERGSMVRTLEALKSKGAV